MPFAPSRSPGAGLPEFGGFIEDGDLDAGPAQPDGRSEPADAREPTIRAFTRPEVTPRRGWRA